MVPSLALDHFKAFKQMQEKQLGRCLKVFHADRGGEFTFSEFKVHNELHGIHHQLTALYTPMHNGVVERKNRIVVIMARSMLKEINLPPSLWEKATSMAMAILNQSPTIYVKGQTPYEALKGKKSSVGHL